MNAGVDEQRPAAPAPPGAPKLVEREEGEGREPSYENPDHVRRLVQRCIADAASNSARTERDMSDMYNQRMYRGGAANQWIWRSRTSQQWEERPFEGDDGIPAWVPRCTTNDFANRIDGLTSLFAASDPAKIVTPATDDDEDVAAADVAQRGIPVLEAEISWPSLKRRSAHLCNLTDKVAFVYYYDNDPKHGTAEIPVYQCAACAQDPGAPMGGLLEPHQIEDADGKCPHCQGEDYAPAMDPTRMGAPLTLTYARGKLCCDLVDSFGFSLPKSATTHDAQLNPWVLLHNTFEPETAVGMWPKFAEIIRNAGAKAGSRDTSVAAGFAEELRTLTAPTSSRATTGGQGSGGQQPVLIYRLQHDPIEDDELSFPEGLYAVMLGDHVLESGPLPLEDSRTGRRRKTILIRTYREMPGSAFGKPPADDMAPIQVSINTLESLGFIAAMHHASPTSWVPDSITLIDEPDGRPGKVNRYRAHGTERPTMQQGSGVHASVFQLLERYEGKMDKLSNLNAVIQGQRPEGGNPTLGETQILREQGMSAFKSPFDTAVDFEKEQTILLLDFARQCMWAPRFRKILGDDGEWAAEQFLGTDLTGHVDITIDTASAWPKSPMMQDLRVKAATELGIVAPAQDPEVAGKILDDWQLGDLKPSLSKARKQIARELDRWRAATSPEQILPPNLAIIDLGLHLFHKRQFLVTEQAELLAEANPAVFAAMCAHVQQLQLAMQPPAPPAAPGKPGPPTGEALDAAVQSGALQPAGAGGDPMAAAVQSGALQPQAPPAPGLSIDQLTAAGMMTPAPQATKPAAPGRRVPR